MMPRLPAIVLPILLAVPAIAAAPVANAPILPGFGSVTAPQPTAPPATSPPAAPSTASDYMALAAQAVAAKQGDPALRALGRAETRLISRSVPLFQTRAPIADPAVTLIRKAREAVAAGDFAAAAALIQQATPVVAREQAHPPPAPPVGLPDH